MKRFWPILAPLGLVLAAGPALAHAIGGKDAAFVASSAGPISGRSSTSAPSTW